MEVFVDFGMFELAAAIGISSVARRVYSHRMSGGLFLLASVALPTIAIFSSRNEETCWLTTGSLATALVNASVVAAVLQRGDVPTLTFLRRPKAKS